MTDSGQGTARTDQTPPAGGQDDQPALARREPPWQGHQPPDASAADTTPGAASPAVEQEVLAELERLRSQVNGVDGSVVATSDGLLVAHDLYALDPVKIAAVIATALGLASQAAQVSGRGHLSEAVIRGSEGNLAVFAIGRDAVLAVLGSGDLNIGMLHYQTRVTVDRIGQATPRFRRFVIPARPTGLPSPARPEALRLSIRRAAGGCWAPRRAARSTTCRPGWRPVTR